MNKILKPISCILVLGLACKFATAVRCRVCNWNQAHRISDDGASLKEDACEAEGVKEQSKECTTACYWMTEGEDHPFIHEEQGKSYNVNVPAGFTALKDCQPAGWGSAEQTYCVLFQSSQQDVIWRTYACFCNTDHCNTGKPLCSWWEAADPDNTNPQGCDARGKRAKGKSRNRIGLVSVIRGEKKVEKSSPTNISSSSKFIFHEGQTIGNIVEAGGDSSLPGNPLIGKMDFERPSSVKVSYPWTKVMEKQRMGNKGSVRGGGTSLPAKSLSGRNDFGTFDRPSSMKDYSSSTKVMFREDKTVGNQPD